MKEIYKYQVIEPESVLMLDAYCVNAFEKEIEYLKKIDIERLLAGFYENAGIASGKIRYGGWENSLIGGHTMGHFLTAISQAYEKHQRYPDRYQLFAQERVQHRHARLSSDRDHKLLQRQVHHVLPLFQQQ